MPNPTIGTDPLSLFEAYLHKRKYSPNSIRNYCKAMQRFLAAIAPLSPADLSSEAVCKAMRGITASCDASESYANHLINAVKCYYDAIEGRQLGDCMLQRPSREAALPKVLQRDEVALLLRLTTNLKHKCMLMLLYGAGLRSSELLALLRTDIDLKARRIRIAGTGKASGRVVPLPDELAPLLADYLAELNPQRFLFEGHVEREAIGERGLQVLVRLAATRAGLGVAVNPGILRHSYAAHLLESGASLQYLQTVMGHSTLRSTSVYLHVARVCKPGSLLEGI